MSLAWRPWFVFVLFAVLVIATRFPLAPGQLFTFDDVNLAYSINHFDIRISQPHPPGYPLFVLEMRVLWWLHFRRVEHLLMVLSLAGSIAALLLLAAAGNRILGGASGFYAACLMVLHPVFWHAGVTSALRVQLAIVSVAVAAACWQAWRGNPRRVLWSAVALGLAAGIRPEIGPLLFPLWAACALRAPVTWRDRAIALGGMAVAVAVWLLPAMIASGGPFDFVKACLDYISDQASVSSGLFGATDTKWRTTFWRMMVWIFGGLPGFVLPAVLAWRRREGWGLDPDRLAFLALWFVPPFVFAVLVHIEDPGQALSIVPVVSLVGGYLMNRALEKTDARIPRWHAIALALAALAMAWSVWQHHDSSLLVIWLSGYFMFYAFARNDARTYPWYSTALVLAALGMAWIVDHQDARFTVLWLPPLCLAAGLALKLAALRDAGPPFRLYLLTFLLAPVVILNLTMFQYLDWYYQGSSTSGWAAAGEQLLADLTSGLALTSYGQIKSTLEIDDHTLQQIRSLARERPGNTVVVWERGLTAWRKVAYYARSVPVVVLEHKKIRSGSPPVIAIWRGPVLERRTQGAAPLEVSLPAGARIVWVLNPRTDFVDLARQSFPLTTADPVYYTDLPQEPGSRTVGEYRLTW
ncbi:MAG TPA: hypothetical protein VE959_03605 [Bryobacteraceae bacterium]|nr:hypothetical protein [Bryobacteraceae bacterium]